RSSEKRPGPAAATEAVTLQMTRLYSKPPFVIQKPLWMCTDPTATTITDATASAANGVRKPRANATPADSDRPAVTAISVGARKPSDSKLPAVSQAAAAEPAEELLRAVRRHHQPDNHPQEQDPVGHV